MSCLRLGAESSQNSVVQYMKCSLDKTNFNVCGAGSGKEQKKHAWKRHFVVRHNGVSKAETWHSNEFLCSK